MDIEQLRSAANRLLDLEEPRFANRILGPEEPPSASEIGAKPDKPFCFSKVAPSSLIAIFTKNPQGVARNMIEASLSIRLPVTVDSIESLDAHLQDLPEMQKYRNLNAESFRHAVTWLGVSGGRRRTPASRPRQVTPTWNIEVPYSFYEDQQISQRTYYEGRAIFDIPENEIGDFEDVDDLYNYLRDLIENVIWDHVNENTHTETLDTESSEGWEDLELSDSIDYDNELTEMREWAGIEEDDE